MNHTNRFDGKGEIYAKARPKYAAGLFDYLKSTLHIADGSIFAGKCNTYRADNSQIYNRQGYVERVLSSSYSLNENDCKYAEYLKKIHDIFDAFSVDNLIAVPTDTIAYIGEV